MGYPLRISSVAYMKLLDSGMVETKASLVLVTSLNEELVILAYSD